MAVIVALPAPITLTTPLTTVTTEGSEDMKLHAPFEVEVGAVREKSGSLTTFWMSAQAPIDGIPTTERTMETGAGESKVVVAA